MAYATYSYGATKEILETHPSRGGAASSVDVGHGGVLLRVLALGSGALGLLVLALQDGLAILVKLQLGDDALGRVDAHLNRRAASLLAGDALDVDDPLLAVALDHLALPT